MGNSLIEHYAGKHFVENIIFDDLVERCVNRFVWKSKEIDTTMFELAINGGVGVLARFKDDSIQMLPATINGKFQLDWKPKGYFPIGFGEMFNTDDIKAWVPFYTDTTRRSYFAICEYYATQIASLDKTLLSAIDNTKISAYVELENAGNRQAVESASKLLAENHGILFIGKKAGNDLKTTVSNIIVKDNTMMLEKIQISKSMLLSQFEDAIGIGNIGREYHTQYVSDTDQMLRGSQYSSILSDCLEWRKKQCEIAKQTLGITDLTVELNPSIYNPYTNDERGAGNDTNS